MSFFELGLHVAPGLAVKIKVSFRTNQPAVLHDKLIVVYGDECEYKLAVPLNAFPPRPIINFNSVLNFGFVVQNTHVSKTITFTNTGSVPGRFAFTLPDDGTIINISPTFGDLAAKGDPGDSLDITFTFTGSNLGDIRSSLEVNVGKYDPPGLMSISASVVTESLQLMLAGHDKPVTNISFGSLYFGQRRKIKTMLFNNSPNPAHFRILYSEGKDPDGPLDDDEEVLHCFYMSLVSYIYIYIYSAPYLSMSFSSH